MGHRLSYNLQQLLKFSDGLTLSDLARETSIPQPTLHHIFEGKTKKPRQVILETLAKYFSVSVEELTGNSPSLPTIPESIKATLKISKIPLIPWLSCKDWAHGKIKKTADIIVDKILCESAFATQLDHSKMEPIFPENSILIFDPLKKPIERDFALIYFKKWDCILFNRFFIVDKKFYLKNEIENGNIELLLLDLNSDKILGTLIEARLQF